MGLDRAFLSLLSQRVVLRRNGGQDKWGNETFSDPETQAAFTDGVTTDYGTGDDDQQEKKAVKTAEFTMDAVGVKLDDQIVFGGTTYTVTAVITQQDEQGADLYQTVTVKAD